MKFTIHAVKLPVPVAVQPNDTYEVVGNQFKLYRNGIVVNTQTLATPYPTVESNHIPSGAASLSQIFVVGVKHMPGLNITITRVTKNDNTGAITVYFSNGTTTEMPSLTALEEIADEVDVSPAIAEKILIGKMLRTSPDGANLTNQVGASISVNLLADVPVVYTEPQ